MFSHSREDNDDPLKPLFSKLTKVSTNNFKTVCPDKISDWLER